MILRVGMRVKGRYIQYLLSDMQVKDYYGTVESVLPDGQSAGIRRDDKLGGAFGGGLWGVSRTSEGKWGSDWNRGDPLEVVSYHESLPWEP